MEHSSSLRPPEAAPTSTPLGRIRTTFSSRDLALKVCVATVAAVVLARLGAVAALGGVAVSLVVESLIEKLVDRLRKRTLWGIALLALLLDHADKAFAAIGLRRRERAAGPGAAAAAIAVAGTLVVAGFTVTESALGHSVVSARRLTFFPDRTPPAVVPTVTIRLPHGVGVKAQGPTPVDYRVGASDSLGHPVAVHCAPPSGSTFRLGRTRVVCRAGAAHGAFVVTVVHVAGPPIVVPSGVHAEATRPEGARVPYTVRSPHAAAVVRCAPASGSLFGFGRTSVHCTARQGGFVTRAAFVVTVSDTRPPAIVVTGSLHAATTTREAAVPFAVSARDAVDGVIPVHCTHPSAGPFPVGTTTVACTARDARGHEARRTLTVVVDHTAVAVPTLVLPGLRHAEAAGPGGAHVPFAASAREGGTAVPVRCDPPSGSLFPIAATTVHCSATDKDGHRTEGSFGVSVRDTEPPRITVPASPPPTSALDPHGAHVTYRPATATDRVDGPVPVACTPASGALLPLGPTTVECTATDSRGNVARASFEVVVKDTTAPTVIVPTRPLAAAALVPLLFAKFVQATDDVDGLVRVSCTPPSGTAFTVGKHPVDCTASDRAGNVGRASFVVVATDRTPPVLTVPESPVTAEAATRFPYDKLVSATDAVDGAVAVSCTPASPVVVAVGPQPIACTAHDAAGNVASRSFTVVGRDTTPPTITVPATTVLWRAGAPLSYAKLVSASDSVDGAITPVCSPPSGSVVAAGLTTVSCTATDRAGNAATKKFTVFGR